jgi:hypothetical protein
MKTGPAASGSEAEDIVTASLVEDGERLQALPRYFGSKLTRAELLVYHWMGAMCPEYSGGYWQFYSLSNGGFYMAPAGGEPFVAHVTTNGYIGSLSPDAAGITACLFAFNQLANTGGREQERFIELFHRLRDFVAFHQEAGQILRAID